MNALIRAAADLQAVCERHGWKFCFIGGHHLSQLAELKESPELVGKLERLRTSIAG